MKLPFLALVSLSVAADVSPSLLPSANTEGGSSTEGAVKSPLRKADVLLAEKDDVAYDPTTKANDASAAALESIFVEKFPLSLSARRSIPVSENEKFLMALNSLFQKRGNLRHLKDVHRLADSIDGLNLNPAVLADLIRGLGLPESLNGVVRKLLNNPDPDQSPFAVRKQGLLPPELLLAIFITTLTGATPADFDITNQVCPRFEDDRKAALDLVLLSTLGYQDFFNSASALTGGNGINAETPGLCTTAYISHEEIKRRIAALPQYEVENKTFRGNELGLFRLNSLTFEFCKDLLPQEEDDFCGIILGMPNEDHMALRPLMDLLWGDGQEPGRIFATSASRWNKEDFVSSAKTFLEGKTSLELSSDAKFWTIKELHMQTLGIRLSDDQVQAFLSLQSISNLLAILPETLVDDVALDLGTSVADVNSGKALFVNIYKTILEGGLLQGHSDIEITKAAIIVLDAFLFAGGLSVPSTIKNGLAAYYTGLTPESFDITNSADLGVLVLETVRSFPPVLGFPYIDGVTGQRHAPLAGFAGYDRRVYGGDADKFRIRGDLAYYHERSVNWADSALPFDGNESSNHVCPARSMSYSMISAFWEALDATQWCVDPETTITEETGPTFWSDFMLKKGACTNNKKKKHHQNKKKKYHKKHGHHGHRW